MNAFEKRLITLAVVIAAAWPQASAAAGTRVVKYYHADALGNVRVVTSAAGTVLERHDYLPFGEECTTGSCAGDTPVGTGQTRKFVGKERDNETGLDYFGARYFTNRSARFTTVDPALNTSGARLNPQRWNRYAYVSNNPLRFVDPDGREQAVAMGGKIYMGGVDGEAAGSQQAQNQVFAGLVATTAIAGGGAIVVEAVIAAGGVVPAAHGLAATAQITAASPATHAVAAGMAEGMSGAPPGSINPGASIASRAISAAEASTLRPGQFASKSIPLRSAARDFSAAERAEIDGIGMATGCHTCGATTAGTKSGHFIVDHQPPVALARPGTPFRGYPHCTTCSFPKQANEVLQKVREPNK